MDGLDEAFAAIPEESSQPESASRLDKRKREILKYPDWDPYSAAKDVEVIDEWLKTHAPKATRCRKATLSVVATAARNLIANGSPKPSREKHDYDGNEDLSSSFTIRSLQHDISHGRDILDNLLQKHKYLDASNLPHGEKVALLAHIQDSSQSEESRMALAEHLIHKGSDEIIHALSEIGRQWSGEFEEEESSTFKYIGHFLDDLIITRSVLAGIIYLSAENDSSWILDGQLITWIGSYPLFTAN